MPAPESLIAKIVALPVKRRAEVEDFVDFIRQREQDEALSQAFLTGGVPAFAAVWNNGDDGVYDDA